MANHQGVVSPQPDEFSSYLHQLLHCSSTASSTSSSSALPFKTKVAHSFSAPFEVAGLVEHLRSGIDTNQFKSVAPIVASSSPIDYDEIMRGAISIHKNLGDLRCGPSAGERDVERIDGPSSKPRSSSKRSRAAEVHNLSEKRRRNRINDNLRALQNLIPNSNKTDKASMLDDAIEYLKQLQLQVQMLSMRNGLSLHPMCLLPGVLQNMQGSVPELSYDAGTRMLNTTTAANMFSANRNSMEPALSFPSQCNIPHSPTLRQAESGFEVPLNPHYAPINPSLSFKDIYRQHAQLRIDSDNSRKKASTGVL